LKSYLEHLPTLSSPEQGQPLILYVSATHSAISGALVTEKEITQNGKTTKQQFPVYFISKVFTGSKRFYSEMEKICYAVITAGFSTKPHHDPEIFRKLSESIWRKLVKLHMKLN
jgi:hypothetical protein